MVLSLLAGVSIVLLTGCNGDTDLHTNRREPAQLIEEYIERKGVKIASGTPEYAAFLKSLLLGGHPELSAHEQKDDILRFASYELDRLTRTLDLVE